MSRANSVVPGVDSVISSPAGFHPLLTSFLVLYRETMVDALPGIRARLHNTILDFSGKVKRRYCIRLQPQLTNFACLFLRLREIAIEGEMPRANSVVLEAEIVASSPAGFHPLLTSFLVFQWKNMIHALLGTRARLHNAIHPTFGKKVQRRDCIRLQSQLGRFASVPLRVQEIAIEGEVPRADPCGFGADVGSSAGFEPLLASMLILGKGVVDAFSWRHARLYDTASQRVWTD